jgi:hypothetical protein
MKIHRLILSILYIAALLPINGCNKDDDNEMFPPGPDVTFYALSEGTRLLKINANAPQLVQSTITITGLGAGETILSIDFRPATGELYGVSSASRLYVINMAGAVRAIGTVAFSPAISSASVSIDFNPTVDRIRLVGIDGQNLRLNPETGTVAATDNTINGPAGAVIAGVAYTNNTSGSTTTTLFDINATDDKLYRQDPPNNGTLVEIGALGTDISGDGGFDISPDGMTALAVLKVGANSNLFTINITTGAATRLGQLANNSTTITDIAIPTNPVAYAIDNATNNLLIFSPAMPGTPVSKSIAGLQAGETLLGLDFRPVNGQLYGLGSTSRLYTINTSNGMATAVGAVPFTIPLSGTSFGFDFNPSVDRVRIVSNTGQNFRVHPETGLAVTPADGNLNPGTPAVSAAAYNNNFAGTTVTTLFDIDATTDKLFMQNPPNNGTLVEVGSLGINIELTNGFDIGSTSNTAMALLTVGSVTKLYSINLTTGAATALADFPAGARAFAIGLGF